MNALLEEARKSGGARTRVLPDFLSAPRRGKWADARRRGSSGRSNRAQSEAPAKS